MFPLLVVEFVCFFSSCGCQNQIFADIFDLAPNLCDHSTLTCLCNYIVSNGSHSEISCVRAVAIQQHISCRKACI